MSKKKSHLSVPITAEDVEKELARRSFLHFITYTMPSYQVNWHHRFLAEKLDKFVRGEIKRLMVFMPPRMGKSQQVSRHLPPYIFGKHPDTQIIACSYSADLASRMNRDVQRIIDSPEYHKVFPDTKLWGKNIRTVADGSYLRNSEIFEIVNKRGVYKSSGVGGAVTGMGANYVIIDDIIKNQEEALSPVYREKVWDWWLSTLYTRLEKDASALVTMTRWHFDDLAGRLLEQAQKNKLADQWEVIDFPAIKDDETNMDDPRDVGDVLWPDKFSQDQMESMKHTMGSRVWNALYQQRPAPTEGNIVSKSWWKYYKQAPDVESMDWVMISWDFTFKGGTKNDYVCGQVWGKKGPRKYLLDMVRDRMSFTESVNAMRQLSAKWPMANENLVEEKANGPAIIDTLKEEIAAIVPYSPTESKEARAHSIAPQIEAGNVYLPDPDLAPWVSDFVTEWAYFPSGKNDDIVDSCTMALNRMSHQFSLLDAITKTDTTQTREDRFKEMFWGRRGTGRF